MKQLFSFCVVFVLLFFRAEGIQAQCGCTHVISLAPTEYIFDGAKRGVKPGDKICFTSGTRTGIGFFNINGTPEKPVIITNMCDGKVILNAPLNWGNAVEFGNSSHFRFTGSGNPNEEFGIEVRGAQMGVNVKGRSTNFEVDHLFVNNVGCVGIVGKTDPTCDPATWRGNFTLRDSKFHHNRIWNTGCEGFYIGNSHYDFTVARTCNNTTIQVREHDLVNIEIYNNDLRNIGNDGIQVGATKNAVIHDNYVFNTGVKNNAQHQNMLQAGNGTQAIVYNNILDTGKGYGIFDSGGGGIYYNNIVLNALLGGMLLQDIASGFAPTGFRVINNTFVHCRDFGVLMFSENLNATEYHNNIIVGQNQSTYKYVNFNNASRNRWVESNNLRTQDINSVRFINPSAKDFRLQSTSPAVDQGRNVSTFGINLDFDLKPRPSGKAFDIGAFELQVSGPTSNAGVDKTVNLPTNTVILNGSGTSPTGPITAYLWTKKSGGVATLVNATTAALTVNDLVEGVYVFQLQVSDANGTATDEVTVTVLPLAVNKAPVANAGADRTVTLPVNSLTLTGSGTDTDGSVVKYAWSKITGPSAALANETTASLGLSGLVEGVYEFQLVVEDNQGATGSDFVKVTVNPAATNVPPTVNAGADRTIFLPTNSVTITATAGDSDGTLTTILWEKRSGPAATLANANTLSLTASALAQGSYIFRITVTDNNGASRFDEVKVDVIQNNQNPVANAGSDKSITLPTNSVSLTGSASDPDGSISSYLWTQVSGPSSANLTNSNLAQVTASLLVQGMYVFRLTVTDNNNATGTDEVAVTVNAVAVNQPPVVSAGPDRTLTLPDNALVLNGSATDADGTIATFLWTKQSGPGVTLTNENTKDLSLADLVEGTYIFNLRATDNDGAFSDDKTLVTVLGSSINQSPVANSGGNRYITLPESSVTLTGVGADPDGTIATYEWVKESGPASTEAGTNTATLVLTNLVEGEYQYRFTVKDDDGATATDFATIRVSSSNLVPLVNAGADQTVALPLAQLVITGTASDPDGTIASYQWATVSGPAVTLTNASTGVLTLSNLLQGSYVFSLTVTDDDGATSVDQFNLLVLPQTANLPPVVNAGNDQNIFLPTNSVQLTAAASDPDGTVVAYTWSQRSGPSSQLFNENTRTLTAASLVEGIYVFRVSVSDNLGLSVFDELTITVKAASVNRAPVVNAGPNQIVQLPTNSTTLSGSASDSDGSIASYGWTKISGPAVTLQNAGTPTLVLSNLLEGTYVFRLTATDNGGLFAFAEAKVVVFPAATNRAPVADAGQNQTIVLPRDNTSLVGAGFDADGSIATFHWTKVSGPASSSIGTPSNAITTVSALVEGVYTFRLTVTDNNGATSFDDVIVTVSLTAGNIPPVADAGGNQVIQLPTNSVVLFGSAADPDGSIASYLWTKVSGGTAVLSNANTATLTVNNLEAGLYAFRLRVTDNAGAVNEDLVNVVVSSATANLAPVANAGPDRVLILPINSTTINGNATDNDGQVTSFSWEKVFGGNATLGNVNTKDLLLTNLAEGDYRFRLSVTDNTGNSDFDEMALRVQAAGNNLPPQITLNSSMTVVLPAATISVNPAVSDPDGTVQSYLWSKVSGPAIVIAASNVKDLSLTGAVVGIYVFRLTVIDDKNTSSSAQISINVLPQTVNQSPVVDAGPDKAITLPANSVQVTATASDPDGSITTILWTKISGGAATITGGATLSPSFTGLLQGGYVFRITVTDNQGATAFSDVNVTVNPVPPNQVPLVDAGVNQNILLPENSITLSGKATDPDGTIASVLWSAQSGPGVPVINSPGQLTSTVTGLIAGTYTFRLTATDNSGAKGGSDVVVFVSDPLSAINLLPVVDAGEDVIVVLPESEVHITGTALDPDGFVENYTWQQVRGLPLTLNANENVLHLADLKEGVYTFSLTAIDDDEGAASDEVSVAVITEEDEIPRFFSPNNDGIKDTWTFRNTDKYAGCSVRVFNRAGRTVFAESPYANNWNGVGMGGAVDDGDYYYALVCPDGRQIKGAVRIIR